MTPQPLAPWHALLAPLPDDAVVKRRPVAPPEITSKPDGAADAQALKTLVAEILRRSIIAAR